ncbi:nicotinamide riboside transporter PnuC [uncultured Draconibacterium sp.]|uniref:nicotinamide riboside transporter PnuC n=1 Tax=uncultured Draconibacterium sp. TaxID=1573823 RepID=UPI003260C89A
MTNIIVEWLLDNKIELLGAILGLSYIYFSIKQHILTWPTGLLTSLLYVVVFYNSKLYADMGLQAYYVVISIYGWYFWVKGKKQNEKKVAVKSTRKILWIKLLVVSIFLYAILFYILSKHTNSDVPHMDSMTTALSLVATWMLARKYLEHWLIWIFVDAFSVGLYLYKGLWATVFLFIVYTIMAVLGYLEWEKDLKNKQKDPKLAFE